ncbi:MAG: hydroxymethylbilane synthase [Rickettsiales bacterium]|jgi:hydroxymethylbilane synthase
MRELKKIIIGSRSSKLSVIQSGIIRDLILNCNSEYRDNSSLIQIKSFTTKADIVIDKSLSEIGGKGLFTREIEESLFDNSVDIAVHSMKDMATICHDDLSIVSVPAREDARDVFISNKYSSLEELPKNAIIGTSSLRRKSIILQKRSDLKIVNFRGNVLTRLSKLDRGEVDATILSYAGIRRLGLEDRVSQIFSIDEFLPAPAQGVIAVQARKNDHHVRSLAKKFNDSKTRIEVDAERLFLRLLDGSCKTPIAAFCKIDNDEVDFRAFVASLDGSKIFKLNFSSKINDHIDIITKRTLEIKREYDDYNRC